MPRNREGALHTVYGTLSFIDKYLKEVRTAAEYTMYVQRQYDAAVRGTCQYDAAVRGTCTHKNRPTTNKIR